MTVKCVLEEQNIKIDASFCHCTFLISIFANTQRRSSVECINSLNFNLFTLSDPCTLDPRKPDFCVVKLGFSGIYIISSFSAFLLVSRIVVF